MVRCAPALCLVRFPLRPWEGRYTDQAPPCIAGFGPSQSSCLLVTYNGLRSLSACHASPVFPRATGARTPNWLSEGLGLTGQLLSLPAKTPQGRVSGSWGKAFADAHTEFFTALHRNSRDFRRGAAGTAEGAKGVREGRSLPDQFPWWERFRQMRLNTASVASVVRSLVISPRSLLLGSGGMCLAIWGPRQRDPVGAGTPSIPGIAQPGETPCRKARQWNRL